MNRLTALVGLAIAGLGQSVLIADPIQPKILSLDDSTETMCLTDGGAMVVYTEPQSVGRPVFQFLNPKSGESLKTVSASSAGDYGDHVIPTVDFDAAGDLAVDVDHDKSKNQEAVNVWDTHTGLRTARYLLPEGALTTLPLLSPNGRFLTVRLEFPADARGDMKVVNTVYDLRTGRNRSVYQIKCTAEVAERFAAFSSDSQILACMSPHEIALIDLPSMKVRCRIPTKPDSTFVTSPDRRYWIMGRHQDGKELVYRGQAGDHGNRSADFSSFVGHAVAVRGSKLLVFGKVDQGFVADIWDLHTGEVQQNVLAPNPDTPYVDTIAWSAKSGYLAAHNAMAMSTVVVWKLQ